MSARFLYTERSQCTENEDSTAKARATTSTVLVLLFTWLFCKPKNAAKYVEFYTSRGYDVLQISSSVLDFLWPPNSKKLALKITQVLKSDFKGYKDIIVHAFSIGAYNFNTCRMLEGENQDLRLFFQSKLRAVVFDSLTMGSLDHMIQPIAEGLSSSFTLQRLIKAFSYLYFNLTHKTTTEAFEKGVDFFKSSPAIVPTLILSSKDDPMCDNKALLNMIAAWQGSGLFPLTYQVWDHSVHCAHFLVHKKQYEQILEGFLASVEVQKCFRAKSKL